MIRTVVASKRRSASGQWAVGVFGRNRRFTEIQEYLRSRDTGLKKEAGPKSSDCQSRVCAAARQETALFASPPVTQERKEYASHMSQATICSDSVYKCSCVVGNSGAAERKGCRPTVLPSVDTHKPLSMYS